MTNRARFSEQAINTYKHKNKYKSRIIRIVRFLENQI